MIHHFSSWIIIWFIIYKLNIINNFPNPKIFVILGIIENLYFLFILFSHHNIEYLINNNDKYINFYIHLIIKLLMLYLLLKTNINNKDIIFGFMLYIIYNIWLYYSYGLNIIEFYKIKYNDNSS
jgi:hypothetical protein